MSAESSIRAAKKLTTRLIVAGFLLMAIGLPDAAFAIILLTAPTRR